MEILNLGVASTLLRLQQGPSGASCKKGCRALSGGETTAPQTPHVPLKLVISQLLVAPQET